MKTIFTTVWWLEGYWCLVKGSVPSIGCVLTTEINDGHLKRLSVFLCGLFLQHRYFRDLMGSQISSGVVKACRSKLQSVRKITASWESSSENWHLGGFMVTFVTWLQSC